MWSRFESCWWTGCSKMQKRQWEPVVTVALMWRTEFCQPGVYEREGSLPLILRYYSRSSYSEYRRALKRHEESTCSKRMMCWQDSRRSHVVGHSKACRIPVAFDRRAFLKYYAHDTCDIPCGTVDSGVNEFIDAERLSDRICLPVRFPCSVSSG